MKPSDTLGYVIYGSLFIFAVWVFYFVAKNFRAFLNAVAWIILLAFVGCVLIVIFQVGYPGH